MGSAEGVSEPTTANAIPFLTPQPLRAVWGNEARDLTPWIARPENLRELGRVAGLGALEFEGMEVAVGAFSADIIARDALGHRVVIENQLERSDHSHLGQLLTYAAGTADTLTMVWIAPQIRSEHRLALQWLNATTPDTVGFFGVEISVWTIHRSPPAAHFAVVVRPERRTRPAAVSAPPSADALRAQTYWAAFREFLDGNEAQHWLRSDLPRSMWWGKNLGRTGVNLYALAKPKIGVLGVTLEIDGHPELVKALQAERAAIECEIGVPLAWTTPGVRYQISTEESGFDLSDEAGWPRQHAWLLDRLERFRTAFRDRVLAEQAFVESDRLRQWEAE